MQRRRKSRRANCRALHANSGRAPIRALSILPRLRPKIPDTFRLAVHGKTTGLPLMGGVRARPEPRLSQIPNSMDPLQIRWPALLVCLPMQEAGYETL